MKIKLAIALLRRKELNEKVAALKQINQESLFEVRVNRQSVTDSVDNVVAKVPKIAFSEITKGYDWHSKKLREIDAIIQQANWNTEVDVEPEVMADYDA